MNVPVTDRFTVDDAIEIYGLEHWGNGYLAIGRDGHLLVRPDRDAERSIDLYRTVRDFARRGKAECRMAPLGKTGHGKVALGMARRGVARQDKTRLP